MHVRFAPKATFTNQDVIRRFVPIATERSAAKSVLIRYFVGVGEAASAHHSSR
jgi:hypothetical protein